MAGPTGSTGSTGATSATSPSQDAGTDAGTDTTTDAGSTPTPDAGSDGGPGATADGGLDGGALDAGAGTPSGATSSLTADPSGIPADGKTTALLTATILDAAGNPLAGLNVNFNASTEGSALWPTSAVTDSDGVARSSLTAILALNDTVQASVGSVTFSTTVAVGLCPGQVVSQSYPNVLLPDGGCFPQETACSEDPNTCCDGLYCDPRLHICAPVVPLGGACITTNCNEGTCQGANGGFEYASSGTCGDCEENCGVPGYDVGMECICGQCMCPPNAPYFCKYDAAQAYPVCCGDPCLGKGNYCQGFAICDTQTDTCACPENMTLCAGGEGVQIVNCCTSMQTCDGSGVCQ